MKRNILFLGLAALALASCNVNEYEDWADPQHSDQEAAKTVSMDVAAAQPIDFATLTADSVQLFVPTVTVSDPAVNNYTVVLHGLDESSIQTVAAGENGMVSSSELQTAYYTLVGRQPVERTINIDVTGYTNVNGESIKSVGSTTATLKADAPVIYAQYYIVGNVNGWSPSDTSIPLSNGGDDQYADPTFSALVPAPADGGDVKFKVFPAESLGDWSATNIISSTANKDEGKFSYANEGGDLEIPAVEDAKYYRVTFNMLDGTWSSEALTFSDRIYEIGNDSGWGSTQTLYGPNNDGKYTGYLFLNGEFKFRPNVDNWDGDWGQASNGAAGKLAQEGESNIANPGDAGYYKVDVDLSAMTYTVTPLTIGIVGNAVGSWDNDVVMTFNASEKCYEVTTTFADGEFKFRANGDWAVNWGGQTTNLTQGAGNLTATAGKHTVKLYINNDGTGRCTIE